jgi:adenylate cyclase
MFTLSKNRRQSREMSHEDRKSMKRRNVKAVIEGKLQRLQAKQALLEDAWKKTGNPDLMHFFIDIIPNLLHSERCSIFILDPKTAKIWLHCGTDLEEREVKVPRSSSIVGNVISSGEYVVRYNVDNVAGAHEKVDLQTGFTTKSVLCVPIRNVAGDKVVGALQVLNKRGNKEFTEEDIKLLNRFAFHLQMNIESVYLRQEISRLSEEMGKKIKKLQAMMIRHGIDVSPDKITH